MTSESQWPSEDLEQLGCCPVCGERKRTLLVSGLRDFSFGAAPGEWAMWRCQSCDCGYLDPRPAASALGRAYSKYYTHRLEDLNGLIPGRNATLKRRIAAGLRNDWINRKLGYRLPGSFPFGALIIKCISGEQEQLPHTIRHLAPPLSNEEWVLDTGCGNGQFLTIAAQLGFKAVGMDFDESAVAAARQAGFDARRGALPDVPFPKSFFTHITLNHVLEHVMWPKQALEALWEVLKPGGRIWITQPNLGAAGATEFGKYWRGFEAPRHMTLFDPPGLQKLLQSCGFVGVQVMRPAPVAEFYFRQSLSQRAGADPYRAGTPPGWNRVWATKAKTADARALENPNVGESLTLLAWKPDGPSVRHTQ
jgi:2-polyprenyl-3-methyl-5-hydroxy-6-metoxy-1,4-benzoquinol methylase